MTNDLMSRKVTGEVLVAYDELIRAWVIEQLKDVGATINEDRVQEMIDSALEEFDGGASTDEIKNVVQEMVESGELAVSSEPQFETISDKTFNNAEEIAESFPLGETTNVILKNVTINSSPDPETFDNVVANVTNSVDGSTRVVKMVTNDGRELEFTYDSDIDPSTATITKTSQISISAIKENLSDLENTVDDLDADLENLSTTLSSTNTSLSNLENTVNDLSISVTNINNTINNIQTNSITEQRVQEMIDASVGAAIADSY